VTASLPLLAIFVVLQVTFGGSSVSAVEFSRPFAPQDGLVSRYEQDTRQQLCLNGSWRFQADNDTSVPGDIAPELGAWDQTAIKIPSPWNVNAFPDREHPGGDFRTYPSYPKAWENLQAAWMERTVNVPQTWSGKRIVLHFGAVGGKLVAYVNGKRAGEGFDIFFAQDFDVTDLVKVGAQNQIRVKVISSRVFDRPGRYGRREYLSGSFWGTHVSGIWQDVFLLAQPKVAIEDVTVQPWVDRDELQIAVTVANYDSRPAALQVSGAVREWLNQVGKGITEIPEVRWKLADRASLELPVRRLEVAPGTSAQLTLSTRVSGRLKLWSPDAPNLYGLLLKLSADSQPIDTKYQRFGWRQFTTKSSQLLLNGAPIVLKGDSWHFMGVPQMTRRYAAAWYQLLKDARANAVRLHASVYPSFYQDMADEMGIMLLDESAIWLSDGGPKPDSDLFWSNCRMHVANLVHRDRNHPSVFGWSVCNEVLPVLRNVWHAPQSMVDHCFEEMTGWVNICQTNDPTRTWISGDGEFDANGRLPTINIHYGGDGELKRAAESGKPWGVGETSMAYYGTPKQVSKFNGNRAYESALGRMEGLAYECYGLLRAQQHFGAAYQSVFNIVWYSIQPLPFGKGDLTRTNAPGDGIFFGAFQENTPGMQPERLGPYTSTLNPGYDPSLPLYRPWPMFEAIRDANSGQTNSRWAHPPVISAAAELAGVCSTNNPALAYLPANAERLAQVLSRTGVKLLPYTNGFQAKFLLVDGSVEADQKTRALLEAAVNDVLRENGTVWVWNTTPAGAATVSALLGEEVGAEARAASSFVVKQGAPLLAGLSTADFYFSEGDDWQQMAYALTGEFVHGAQVVLKACPAQWRQWNYRAEPIKTASLFRSEVETTGSLVAIATRPVKGGQVLLCNLSPQIRTQKKSSLLQRLFLNEGIGLDQVSAPSEFLDLSGRLVRALSCGSFPVADPNSVYTGKLPGGEIKEGAKLDGHKWRTGSAEADGVFDFKKGLVQGEQENAVAYLAIWLKSPKPLNDLLSEPNLPKLSFSYGSDDGCELWLNGQLLASHNRHGPLEPEMFSENPLLLHLGWNQLVIKVVQGTGEWKFTGKFGCSDLTFLQKLDFATEKPAGAK
jgi:beta-galactosidase